MSLFECSKQKRAITDLAREGLCVGDKRLKLTAGERLHHYELISLTPEERELKSGQISAQLERFELRPTLLDRPLVLALDQPLHVPPRSQCTLNLSRPLAFDVWVSGAEEEPHKLLSSSTRALRLTSYGQITDPMICYHWRSTIDVLKANGDEALVPLMVSNQTKHPVELKKVILYKSFLKLFRAYEQFVTNQVSVLISSKSEAYLEYSERPPERLGPCELIFDPKHEGELAFLKILRLVGKRGTGIEYGF